MIQENNKQYIKQVKMLQNQNERLKMPILRNGERRIEEKKTLNWKWGKNRWKEHTQIIIIIKRQRGYEIGDWFWDTCVWKKKDRSRGNLKNKSQK